METKAKLKDSNGLMIGLLALAVAGVWYFTSQKKKNTTTLTPGGQITETPSMAAANAASESTVNILGVAVPTTTPGAAVTMVYTPAQIAALAAENTAIAANPGNAEVYTDSRGNQYVINASGEAVYLGVPTFD